MKKNYLAITFVFLAVTLLFTAAPAAAGEQWISTATATGELTPITITGQWTGLKMKLEKVINASCKFEIYNQWGQYLWRGPTFSSDYELSWENYFTYKDGKRYYKNTNKEVQELKIKAYISLGSATMHFYLID